MDQGTREYFDRLMHETVDGRRALERRVDTFHDEMLTNFDGVFKKMDDLKDEYHALRAAVSRLEASVSHLEQESRNDQSSRQQVLREVAELRTEASVVMERLGQLEAALRGNPDA